MYFNFSVFLGLHIEAIASDSLSENVVDICMITISEAI